GACTLRSVWLQWRRALSIRSGGWRLRRRGGITAWGGNCRAPMSGPGRGGGGAVEPGAGFWRLAARAGGKERPGRRGGGHRVTCKQLSPNGPLKIKGSGGVEKGGEYGDSGRG